MINSSLEIVIAMQCFTIVFGAIAVLQGVLNRCSKLLRLAFIIFPIGASLVFLDMVTSDGVHITAHVSAMILNVAIMLILYWMWNQKDMFVDVTRMIENKHLASKYNFTIEVKAILSCFAIWILKRVNPDLEYKTASHNHTVAE